MEYWFGDCSNADILVVTDKKQYKEVEIVSSNLISKSIRHIIVDNKELSIFEYEKLTPLLIL